MDNKAGFQEMTLAELIIKSYDQTLTREQRGEYYRQAVEMAQKEITKPKRAKKTDVHPDFEEWYRHYPHKVARGYAEKAYVQARGIATQEQLIKGANWYAQNKPEETPWAHPASWLNAKRWLDGEAEAVTWAKPETDWPEWKERIAGIIGRPQTATWFKGAEIQGNSIIIPNQASYSWIKDRYMSKLELVMGNFEVVLK